jgi:flavodoxin
LLLKPYSVKKSLIYNNFSKYCLKVICIFFGVTIEKNKGELIVKFISAVLVSLFFVTAGCQQTCSPVSGDPEVIHGIQNKSKAVILYYSRTGDTRVVAGTIREALDCDLQEIKDLKDRSGLKGFFGGMKDVSKKVKAEIKPETLNLDDYALIFLCSPVWGMQFAPAITTFMSTMDFKDKKIVLVAVARMNMKAEKLEEMNKEIGSKGGEVVKDFVVKTWFQSPEKIKEQTKEHIKDITDLQSK